MNAFRLITLLVLITAALAWTGCGSHEALVSVTVSPSSATATHGSANDTVTFKATGYYSSYSSGGYGPNASAACLLPNPNTSRPLTSVTWSTSDSTNTSIDSGGVAKCLGTTPAPATITALGSGICGGEKATALLTCN